ncbi:hypothetical protein [Candidatus Leptofilum sp.]|uniref:hypothetical protein n=1 Tax=Candidatus Leptofilum sp. TaxID=3241576 RepID=UPI003B5A6A4A
MTQRTQPPPDFYCTDWSVAIDEPLAGTAVSSKVWLFTVEATKPLTTYPSSGSLKAKTFPQFNCSL